MVENPIEHDNPINGINPWLMGLVFTEPDEWNDELCFAHTELMRRQLQPQLDKLGRYTFAVTPSASLKYKGQPGRSRVKGDGVIHGEPRPDDMHADGMPPGHALPARAPVGLAIVETELLNRGGTNHPPVLWFELLSRTNKLRTSSQENENTEDIQNSEDFQSQDALHLTDRSQSIKHNSSSLQFGRHADSYNAKIRALLRKGVTIAEFDYLPDSDPLFQTSLIPRYPTEQGSKAYYMTVAQGGSDAHPNGQFWPHTWGVGETPPIVPLPLLGSDIIHLDLNELHKSLYQRLFPNYKDMIRYDQPPRLNHLYSAHDQNLMKRIWSPDISHER